jgi:hypothetical protein
MENQTVENQTTEGQEFPLEEVSTWAAKAVEEIFSDLEAFEAMTDEERKQDFLSKGFPPELFTEPLHSFFLAEIFYKNADMFVDELFRRAVVQAFEKEYKANIFVRFMRLLTWDSFKESLTYTDLAREIERELDGTVRKAPKRKGKHVIPFWFRNFDKEPIKECVHSTGALIIAALESADEYMTKYLNAIRQENENTVESKG